MKKYKIEIMEFCSETLERFSVETITTRAITGKRLVEIINQETCGRPNNLCWTVSPRPKNLGTLIDEFRRSQRSK